MTGGTKLDVISTSKVMDDFTEAKEGVVQLKT